MLRRRTISRIVCLAIFAVTCCAAPALCPSPARAQVDGETETPGHACPTGATPGQAASANWDTIFECNASGNWQRGPYFFGATADTCDSNHAGMVQWTGSSFQGCNGTSWSALVQVQSTTPPTAPSGSGYFVLTKTTWDGNLGGKVGADAKCLTELSSTNTTWAGYSTANSNGQLISAKVHAFFCTGNNCTNLMPLTTYYFAYAGNSSVGGASFTTDSSGFGPYDSISWAAANRFGGTFTYWTGRAGCTSTAWCNSASNSGDDSNNCLGYTSNSSSYGTGSYGSSAATDAGRWDGGYYPNSNGGCANTLNLVCFVNP